jgi:hypothetical protein
MAKGAGMDSVGLKNLVVGLILGIGVGAVAIRYLGFTDYLSQHWLLKLAFGYGCWTVGMLFWMVLQLVIRRSSARRPGTNRNRH